MQLQGTNRQRIITALEITLVFAVNLIVTGYFSTIGVDPHHDGILIKPALDVSRGLMLFRDTFTQYGALTTLIQALAIKLFGEYLIVIKLTTAVFSALSAVVLFQFWKKLLPAVWVWAIIAVYVFLGPYYTLVFHSWSSVYAIFFQCLLISFGYAYVTTRRPLYMVVSGAMAACIFWCRQSVGIFTTAAVLVFFVILFLVEKQGVVDIAKSLGRFLAGNLVVYAAFLAWLSLNGALGDWWIQSIYFAFFFGSVNNGGPTIQHIIYSLFPRQETPFSVLPFLTILMLIKILLSGAKRKEFTDKDKSTLFIVAVCLASWLQFYPIIDIRHLYWSVVPMIGLIVYFIYEHFRTEGALYRFAAMSIILYLIFGNALVERAKAGYRKHLVQYSQMDSNSFFYGLRLTDGEHQFFDSVEKDIRRFEASHPSGRVVNLSIDGLYPAISKYRPNPHKMHVYWPDLIDAKYPDYYQSLTIDPETLYIGNVPAKPATYLMHDYHGAVALYEPFQGQNLGATARLYPDGVKLVLAPHAGVAAKVESAEVVDAKGAALMALDGLKDIQLSGAKTFLCPVEQSKYQSGVYLRVQYDVQGTAFLKVVGIDAQSD